MDNLYSIFLQTVLAAVPPPDPDIAETKLKEKFGGTKIEGDIPTLATNIFNTVLGIAGIVFLLMLLFGAFSYLLGAGNDEKTGKAKKMMVDATIGVVLCASAYGIGTFIINLLVGKP